MNSYKNLPDFLIIGAGKSGTTNKNPVNTQISIGNYINNLSDSWEGYIDECVLYDRFLNSSERTDLYNSGYGRNPYSNITPNNTYFDGKLDELLLYNYELDADDIETLYLGYNTLQVNLKNPISKNYITDIVFNLDVIGTNYQSSDLTISGISTFSMPYTISNQELTIRAYGQSDDYSIVQQIYNYSTGINYNATLYLVNTSDVETTKLVTLKVFDNENEVVQDATIQIYRQDANSSSYLLVTELITNPNGEAAFIYETDNVFYRHVILYDGETVYSESTPYPISLNDEVINFNVVIGLPFSLIYQQMFDTTVNMSWINTTNVSGYFSFLYQTPSTSEGCLVIEYFNGTEIERTCTNSSYARINSSTLSPSENTLYLGKMNIDYKDGEGLRFVDQLPHTIYVNATFPGDDNQAMFWQLLLITICAFGFLANPIVGLILFMVGTIVLYWILPQYFNLGYVGLIVMIASIVLFSLTRNKKQ